jgi:hypothetical protein
MRRPQRKKDSVVVMLARAGLAKRRRNPAGVLILTAIIVTVLGLFTWWLWPKAAPRQLALVVYDQVVHADEEIELLAQVQGIGEPADDVDYSGSDIYFVAPHLGLERKVTTNRAGLAELRYALPAGPEKLIEYDVRCPGDGGRRRGATELGRIFRYNDARPLLFVDVEHGLAAGDLVRLEQGNHLDIAPAPGAVQALRSLSATRHVVYFSAGTATALDYLHLRNWLRRGWAAVADRFPEGPVFCLAGPYRREDADEFLRALTSDLRQRLKLPVHAVTQAIGTAKALHAVDVKTVLLGEAAEDFASAKAWNEVSAKLP